MATKSEAIIIGGGVIGASAAWRLAARGVDVTLLEQFEPGHDRGSSHGTSRIFRLAYPHPPYVRLAQEALRLWQQLESDTDRRVLTLTGAVDHGDQVAIDTLRAALNGAALRSELLAPTAAHERWPGIRFDGTVLYHPDAGRLHADDAVAALTAAAVSLGATVRHGVQVDSITRTLDGGAEVVTSDGDVLVAGQLVVTAGGWTPGLVPTAPLPALRVTQEQPAHFRVADDSTEWPSFIHHPPQPVFSNLTFEPAVGTGVYGLGNTGADGSEGLKAGFHAIGAVVDPRHRDRTVDVQVLDDLKRYASLWLPGVDPDSAEASTCLYTLSPDHNFVIDRDGPVVVATGFSGHGFKFGPAVGELIAELVLDRCITTPDLFAFGSREVAAPAA